MDDDQMKIHLNPLSKEGLASVVVKLSTDIEWIKKNSTELNEKVENNNTTMEELVKELKNDVSITLEDHEERIRDLERAKNRLWGAIGFLGALASVIIGLLQYLK